MPMSDVMPRACLPPQLGLSTPAATCPLVRPKMTMPERENDQQCFMIAKGATPRSSTTPSARPATMKDSPTHHTMPDPNKQPREWVRAYIQGMRTPPNWWPELLTLNQGCMREVMQQQAKRQAVGF